MEIWRSQDGSEIGVLAATWELNPKVTFESLEAEFRSNPVKAWRNYGSRVDLAIENAIKDTGVVLRHCNLTRMNPWNPAIEDYAAWFRGRPGYRYFVHFDLSKNRDATGVAMTHRERTGVVVVDFMHRIEAKLGKDINFGYLREQFVYALTNRGFHIHMVSYDQFQSDETRQVLEEKGYITERVSADKTTEAYDTLIEQVLTGRLDYYNHPVFIRELEELKLVNGTKYDHPKKTRTGRPGSKDVCDAVACATLSAIRWELENPAPPPGAMRIYRQKPTVYERGAY